MTKKLEMTKMKQKRPTLTAKTANFSDRETDTGLAGELMDENLVEASRELFKEMADIAGEPEPLVPLHAPEQGREAVEDFVKKKMAAAL